MKKIIFLLTLFLTLSLVSCSSSKSSNKQIMDIYTYKLKECINSIEYKNWEEFCRNLSDRVIYNNKCSGINFCEKKLKELAKNLSEM